MNDPRRKPSARQGLSGLRVAMVLFGATSAAESLAETTSSAWPVMFFRASCEGIPAAQACGKVVKSRAETGPQPGFRPPGHA